jgi:hypothetical protein
MSASSINGWITKSRVEQRQLSWDVVSRFRSFSWSIQRHVSRCMQGPVPAWCGGGLSEVEPGARAMMSSFDIVVGQNIDIEKKLGLGI